MSGAILSQKPEAVWKSYLPCQLQEEEEEEENEDEGEDEDEKESKCNWLVKSSCLYL